MLPRERVIEVIRRRKPDRIPIYGWVSANLTPQITESYGSVAAFEDHYEFDYAHLFGGPPTYSSESLEKLKALTNGPIAPASALDLPQCDPNASGAYQDIVEQIRHHKEQRNRFVYVQTPGIFEALNGVFGIENHLVYMLMYPQEIAEIYHLQAKWNQQFAMNCLDLGVDMIHVSDDWGAQNGLLFHKDLWRDLIFPNHKSTTDLLRKRNAFYSLHSDGNINDVVEGIIELGYQVVHPWQESAGMSLADQKRKYGDKFVVMGGLDVQKTIGFGKYDHLQQEIERVLRLFRHGGLLFCTTHFVQEHCGIEELSYAYDIVFKRVRELPREEML